MKFTCTTSYSEQFLREAMVVANDLRTLADEAGDADGKALADKTRAFAARQLSDLLKEKCHGVLYKAARDAKQNREKEAEMAAEHARERCA